MSYSRIPLHMQNQEIAKAIKKNPSYESFRPNIIHKPQYQGMEDRATISEQYRIRRDCAGNLDLEWTVNKVLDALYQAEGIGFLTPVEESLLTVLFPMDFQFQEPMLAEIRTQLSDTEKKAVKTLVLARLEEQRNWSAGRGGTTYGGTRTRL